MGPISPRYDRILQWFRRKGWGHSNQNWWATGPESTSVAYQERRLSDEAISGCTRRTECPHRRLTSWRVSCKGKGGLSGVYNVSSSMTFLSCRSIKKTKCVQGVPFRTFAEGSTFSLWKVHEYKNCDGMLQKGYEMPWKGNMELLFTFAGRCYNWAFSGEEHMRDEHGCSVSPSHLSLLDLWVKWFPGVCFCVLGVCVLWLFLLFLLPTSPSDPFLHNYCKNTSSAN